MSGCQAGIHMYEGMRTSNCMVNVTLRVAASQASDWRRERGIVSEAESVSAPRAEGLCTVGSVNLIRSDPVTAQSGDEE